MPRTGQPRSGEPAAEEHDRGQRGDQDHVGVLGQEEQREHMPEYSTWKPATISDSPSATSNGARLVSATPEMKYTTNMGTASSQFHEEVEAVLAPGGCRRCHRD